jgi:hypothetical protein
MRRGIGEGVNISPWVGDREDDADVDGEHMQNVGAPIRSPNFGKY